MYMHSSRCKPLLASTAEFLATFMYHHIEHMHTLKKKAAAIISTSVAQTPRFCILDRFMYCSIHVLLSREKTT